MDQDTFRSFLSTSRAGGASSTAGSSSSSRVFGGGGRHYGSKPPKADGKQTDDAKSRKPKKQGKYIDRAAARRMGLDDEFTDVLAMGDEFERQHAEGGVEDIEEKRKLLGGDAEHSILVKGLDLALLARNKAELEGGEDEVDEDDELEAAFGAGSSSALPPAVDDEPATKKRTREEILAAVQSKRRALGGGQASATAPSAESLSKSKFKPIGGKEDKKSKKTAVVGPDGQVKKLKKKKKVVAEQPLSVKVPPIGDVEPAPTPPSLPAPPPLVIPTSSRPINRPSASAVNLSPPQPPSEPPSRKLAKPLIVAALDDDDDDIFGGVGEYEGDLGSDSDDETKPSASKSAGAQGEGDDPAPVPTVNWFKTGRTPSPPPEAPSKILTAASLKGKERDTSGTTADDADPADDGPQLSRFPSPEEVTRLVPLSGTSARDLLARANEAEAAAVRRSNKAKWRQSQGLSKQADDDDDDEGGQGNWRAKEKDQDDHKRRNKEFQQYQNYVKKNDK